MTEEKKNLKLKSIIYIILLLFLGISTFFLMGNASQRPLQIGFGLFYLTFTLNSIYKRIHALEKLKKIKTKLEKMKKDFDFSIRTFFIFFTAFSTLIFILANKDIINNLMSSLWLLSVIFLFQGFSFLYLVTYIDKHKPKTLSFVFGFLYSVGSIVFGWTSAWICSTILKLPAREDLFFATYGVLILPILFIIYFDYVFSYKPEGPDIVGDVKKQFKFS